MENLPRVLEAAPGPWSAWPASVANGACYIEDANGEIIGFATDVAGHTTERAGPDRRTPEEILCNAYRMALAPAAIETLGEIASAAAPQLLAVLRRAADTVAGTVAAKDVTRLLDGITRAKAIAAADHTCAIMAANRAYMVTASHPAIAAAAGRSA